MDLLSTITQLEIAFIISTLVVHRSLSPTWGLGQKSITQSELLGVWRSSSFSQEAETNVSEDSQSSREAEDQRRNMKEVQLPRLDNPGEVQVLRSSLPARRC